MWRIKEEISGSAYWNIYDAFVGPKLDSSKTNESLSIFSRSHHVNSAQTQNKEKNSMI